MAGPGAEAAGGGVFNYAGTLHITRSALVRNQVLGGTAGDGFRFGAAGGDAYGGALACAGGATTLANDTLSSNFVRSGDGDSGSLTFGPGLPGIASGGGIRATGGTLSLLNCTVAENEVRPGVAIDDGHTRSVAGERHGGGIYATGSTPLLRNILFARNRLTVIIPGAAFTPASNTVTPSDGEGTFSSMGDNLIETSTDMQGLAPTDKVDVPALIEPLANNGGLTPTHALLPGSPAIDGGSSLNAPSTDQRGVLRPQGPGVDIGAYEQAPLAPKYSLVLTTSGQGSVSASPQPGPYLEGTTVSLTATTERRLGI
jgi:hypothetical protein